MRYEYSDGGRKLAGYRGNVNDCVTRAIAIASEMSYQAAYDLVSASSSNGSAACERVANSDTRAILASLGWQWQPTMHIGQGCTLHLDDNLPMGRLIVKVSKHVCAVIDRVVYDTFDPRRDGTRCVYGYWTK
jgi:hypothetical protein